MPHALRRPWGLNESKCVRSQTPPTSPQSPTTQSHRRLVCHTHHAPIANAATCPPNDWVISNTPMTAILHHGVHNKHSGKRSERCVARWEGFPTVPTRASRLIDVSNWVKN